MDLLRQGPHVFEQIKKNRGFADSIIDGQDVVDRRAAIAMKGLAFEYDRMSSAWHRLVTVLAGGEQADQGSFRGLAMVYKNIADSIASVTKSINEADPARIEAIGKALLYMGTAAATIAAVGVGMAAIAKSVAIVTQAAPGLLTGGAALLERDRVEDARKFFEQKGGEQKPMPDSMKPWLWRLFSWLAPAGDTPTWSPGKSNYSLTGKEAEDKAKLEGTATVRILVEGPGQVVGQSTTGNIKLDTGRSMPDIDPAHP
jgi:hypothetical protein